MSNINKELCGKPCSGRNKTAYDLKIVDLDNPLTTELFVYNY